MSLFLVSPGDETLPITLFNYLEVRSGRDNRRRVGGLRSCSPSWSSIGLDRTVGLRTYVKL